MATSPAFKRLENSTTPEQVQNLLSANSLRKVYKLLKVSDVVLLRYINQHHLTFDKAFRTLKDLTNVVIRHYKLKTTIGYEWDHKFSVCEGFYQNIHPAIIASLENLELIPAADNRSNGRDCSISRDELINSVCYQSL
jgi:hypothetical protein